MCTPKGCLKRKFSAFFWIIFAGQVFTSFPQDLTTSDLPPAEPEDTLPPSTVSSAVATDSSPTTTRTIPAPLGVEIIHASVESADHNAVRLVWGCDRKNEANYTYGVHYGTDEPDLTYPKLTTPNVSAVIPDLEFCTKYLFGISISEERGAPGPGRVNLNDVRSVITGADRLDAPKDLQVEYEPKEQPCMLIRWSAPCENVVEPMGYLISVFEKNQSRYKDITISPTKRADIVYHLPVKYGAEYEVTVSTATPGAIVSEPVSLSVPEFLQPWRMRIAVDSADDAFLIYWAEPYVPPSLTYRYYYEVLVYEGVGARGVPERYYVTRPAIVYKSAPNAYTFRVRLVSLDRARRSPYTAALTATPAGDVAEVPAEDPPEEGVEEVGERRRGRRFD